VRSLKTLITAFAVSVLLLPDHVFGQDIDYKLDEKERALTIDSINLKLKTLYVYPKVAEEMATFLEKKLREGEYKTIIDPIRFSEQLTSDLQSISHDKHLRVIYGPKLIAERANAISDEDIANLEKKEIEQMRQNNFGFKEVKILDGNIGYLDLRGFDPPEYGGSTAVAAMNFLSNADALIIDLRYNGGGSTSMIQLISSYLFEGGDIHLNNLYFRPNDENRQTWTLPYVPGKRLPETDVYILTSKRTFSAAEEFCYNLKNLNRATLIGETTGGGAHPVEEEIATSRYMVWIPKGRAINPITNTNWEGTGVTPHIETNADEALMVAQIKALEKLVGKATDDSRIYYLNWQITGLKAKYNPVIVEESVLKSYAGNYGIRSIKYENNNLYYERGAIKYQLIPMGEDLFMVNEISIVRFHFVRKGNQIVAMEGLFDDGNIDNFPKSKN